MMTDEAKPTDGAKPTAAPSIPAPGYPPVEFVSIYADGVTSVLPGIHTVKFYISRDEPNYVVTEPNKATVVAQVVMPISGFVQTVSFFQTVIKNMETSGTLSPDILEQIRTTVTPKA
jgi:hypothetical protein